MRFLELRIPPPVVGLISAAGMWAVAHLPPLVAMPRLVRLFVTLLLLATGVAVALGGVVSFRRARTTVNPLKPETTAALVVTGVYSFTRNPMYQPAAAASAGLDVDGEHAVIPREVGARLRYQRGEARDEVLGRVTPRGYR